MKTLNLGKTPGLQHEVEKYQRVAEAWAAFWGLEAPEEVWWDEQSPFTRPTLVFRWFDHAEEGASFIEVDLAVTGEGKLELRFVSPYWRNGPTV